MVFVNFTEKYMAEYNPTLKERVELAFFPDYYGMTSFADIEDEFKVLFCI